MRTLLAIVMLIATVATDVSSDAADRVWPGWLGPKRDGSVPNIRVPKEWPEKLNKSWQVEVGTGYGSPLVANGLVFQHARQGEDEVVWCLDLETGAKKWRKSYATPFKIGGGGERHGKGPKSCPAYADGRIFTLSITGVLSAWDAESGKSLWQQDYSERFKKGHPYWGASASPIVDENRVIVHLGNDDAGALLAFDTATGKEIWSQGEDGASYSSPLVVDIAGTRQVIDWNHRALVSVESATGKKLWEFPFPHEGHNQNMPTPTFRNGIVFLGGENRGIYGLRPELKKGEWTIKQLWHQKKLALDMSSAIPSGKHLFGFSHYSSGRIFRVNAIDGEISWQSPGRTGRNVTFLSVPGTIIALLNNGHLQVINANAKSYQKVADYKVAETETWAPPVLLPHGVLIKDDKHLTLWKY